MPKLLVRYMHARIPTRLRAHMRHESNLYIGSLASVLVKSSVFEDFIQGHFTKLNNTSLNPNLNFNLDLWRGPPHSTATSASNSTSISQYSWSRA